MEMTRGLIPTLFNISEEEIQSRTEQFKKQHPKARIKKDLLRCMVINTIVNEKKLK